MPAMLRIKGKPTQIAYSILGIPNNIRSKRTKERQKLEKMLTQEETVRVR